MTAIDDRLNAILADPLAEARAATRAIGYVGFDIPAEILAASGRHPCHLPWSADRETPFADAWLERSFGPWSRSILEAWAAGEFDFLEAVVFSRGDDSAQRLYYYVSELQRQGRIAGPKPLIFDIARVPRESSAKHTVAAVRRLSEALDVTSEGLSKAIGVVNRRRAIFASLLRGRINGGGFYERIARASLFADLDSEIGAASLPEEKPLGKVVLIGTPPPDERLHEAVEATGWTVAMEIHDRSLRRLGPVVTDDDGDPAAAIGRHAHAHAPGPRSFADRSPVLLEEVGRTRARAAILWVTEEDEVLAWRVPALKAALENARCPALIMTGRAWNAADGAAEEIKRFIEGLSR